MFTIRKSIVFCFMLAGSAVAQSITFQGQIALWPVGKTGVLKVMPVPAQYVPSLLPDPLASAPINARGEFKVTIKGPFPEKYLLPDQNSNAPCKGEIKPRNPRSGMPSFWVYNKQGQAITMLDLKSQRYVEKDTKSMMVVGPIYVPVTTSFKFKCTVEGTSLDTNMVLQPGWNIMEAISSRKSIQMRKVTSVSSKVYWWPWADLNGL
ncbi:hypothetical protein [Deinococcus roseus]|uniref:Ig-like domain-containing protein n=1 Tax=Deinococcus roseus TaxID=392414 RepID=A0ABQ2DA66_9DEIO|nr:hypothetical protein [Deinococcus roseus]GGJ51371.1 hypothetical protein GCM10008938_41710 [Deinococcus roseus]